MEPITVDIRRVEGSMVGVDAESRKVSFRASTPALDRHGSRVMPMGIDTKNFEKNPIFLWGHDGYGGFMTPAMENVLGRVVNMRKDSSAFDIDVDFADEKTNPKAEMALRMVKAGFLSAVSIGFIPDMKSLEVVTENGMEIPVINNAELLEVSLVSIPSNPEALTLVRSMVANYDLKEILNAAKSHTAVDMDIMEAIREHLAGARETIKEIVQTSLSTAPGTKSADTAVVMGEAVRRAFLQWQIEEEFRFALDNNLSQLKNFGE